jgi:pimeloyl-ACP methyl ester carboxylesterase
VEQQIRFCTSSDGTRIACATVGQGPPLVRALGWLTHLEYEWENPLWRFFIDAMSRRYLLVRFDGRGMGLSDRRVSDYSLEAQVRDLEAVVDTLGLERFALYGISQGGPTAITYAVRHPERVSHLILYGSFARFLDTEEGRQQAEAMFTLIRQGWGSDVPAFRQLFTNLFMPDADIDAIRAFNELERVSASADNVVGLMTAVLDIDVTQLLPQVTVPTLVIHRRGDAVAPFESGRELATGIPGARFLPLDGSNHWPLPNESAAAIIAKAIYDFSGEGEEAALTAEPTPAGAVQTILFTDVEGSTALTQRPATPEPRGSANPQRHRQDASRPPWLRDQAHRRRHHGFLRFGQPCPGMRYRHPARPGPAQRIEPRHAHPRPHRLERRRAGCRREGPVRHRRPTGRPHCGNGGGRGDTGLGHAARTRRGQGFPLLRSRRRSLAGLRGPGAAVRTALAEQD